MKMRAEASYLGELGECVNRKNRNEQVIGHRGKDCRKLEWKKTTKR